MESKKCTFSVLKIEDIKPGESSSKLLDKNLTFRLSNAIRKYGVCRTILVAKEGSDYFLIEGRNILEAAKICNLKEAPCMVYEGLSKEERLFLSISLNEFNYLTDYVEIARNVDIIRKTIEDSTLSSILPYEIDEYERLKRLLDFDWSQFEEKTNQVSLFEMPVEEPAFVPPVIEIKEEHNVEAKTELVVEDVNPLPTAPIQDITSVAVNTETKEEVKPVQVIEQPKIVNKGDSLVIKKAEILCIVKISDWDGLGDIVFQGRFSDCRLYLFNSNIPSSGMEIHQSIEEPKEVIDPNQGSLF